MIRELDACSDLLDNVESRELNDEQAKAVVCFDNRVQLIASAGSGKTSTMVAKAIYAVHRGFVAPSEIIMLAFNKDAARELQERGAQSLARLGSARHGRRHDQCTDIPLTDTLKDRSDMFRTKWDLFRLVFGRDQLSQNA